MQIKKLCSHLNKGTRITIDDFDDMADKIGLRVIAGPDYFDDGRPTLWIAHVWDGFIFGLWHCVIEIQGDKIKSTKIFFEPFPELF